MAFLYIKIINPYTLSLIKKKLSIALSHRPEPSVFHLTTIQCIPLSLKRRGWINGSLLYKSYPYPLEFPYSGLTAAI